MVKHATFGVVQEFDYALQMRQDVSSFAVPQEQAEGEFEGRKVTTHCCQIIPGHLLDKVTGSDHHHLDEIKERLRAKANLYTEAREQRRSAAAVTSARALKAINYTIVDANGNEDFNDDKVVSDPSTNETAARLLLFAQRTMDLLKNFYQWNGIDNKNMLVKAFFNYGENYDNAFWNGQEFFCGTGDGQIFDDFSEYLDVVGHELNHGVNQFKKPSCLPQTKWGP
jgi:Zn-dependent metalloprotease